MSSPQPVSLKHSSSNSNNYNLTLSNNNNQIIENNLNKNVLINDEINQNQLKFDQSKNFISNSLNQCDIIKTPQKFEFIKKQMSISNIKQFPMSGRRSAPLFEEKKINCISKAMVKFYYNLIKIILNKYFRQLMNLVKN